LRFVRAESTSLSDEVRAYAVTAGRRTWTTLGVRSTDQGRRARVARLRELGATDRELELATGGTREGADDATEAITILAEAAGLARPPAAGRSRSQVLDAVVQAGDRPTEYPHIRRLARN
jgi:hypothetical protein